MRRPFGRKQKVFLALPQSGHCCGFICKGNKKIKKCPWRPLQRAPQHLAEPRNHAHNPLMAMQLQLRCTTPAAAPAACNRQVVHTTSRTHAIARRLGSIRSPQSPSLQASTPQASPMTDAVANVRLIARQHAQTARLMGIDFLPVRMESQVPQAATEAAPAIASAERASSPVPQRSADEKRRLLEELRARHDSSCPHCSTITNYTNTVFGEGSPDAQLLFIGEAPGEDEDLTGRPFVGRAGQKLNEIIKAMKLQREDVYIANVLKARPPNNRPPQPDEVAKCSPFLREQIRIISPRVIVALGGPSAKLLLQTDLGITRLRGQWGVYADGDFRVPIMPTFHPAYLLRNYTPQTRQQVWHDMQAVLARLEE